MAQIAGGIMQKPFQQIIDARRYDLVYVRNGPNRINISNIILRTHQQYATAVDQRDFTKLISTLCNGAASSVLSHRREPTIILEICRLFPACITTKNVDDIIKCMHVSTYPQNCIEAISKTGHVFTRITKKKIIFLWLYDDEYLRRNDI